MRNARQLVIRLTSLSLGVANYWVFIVLLLGLQMSPLGPNWPWQLDFEHGELQADHYARLLGIALAALPVAVIIQVAPGPRVRCTLVLVGCAAAAPYFFKSMPPYGADSTWLLAHSVGIESAKIALAPLLWGSLLPKSLARKWMSMLGPSRLVEPGKPRSRT